MDVFIVILIALFPCWLIVYLSPKFTLEIKYQISIINFFCSLLLISGIYFTSYGIWKFPIIYWFLLPNILMGSILPIIFLIVYVLWLEAKNKQKS